MEMIIAVIVFVSCETALLYWAIERVAVRTKRIEYKIDWYIQETLRFNPASPYVKQHGLNTVWTPPIGAEEERRNRK